MSTSKAKSLSSSLSGLSISTSAPASKLSKPAKKAPVAESWDEDDDADSDASSDTETEPKSPSQPKSNNSSYTKAPPPTPATLSPSIASSNFSSNRQYFGNNIDAAFDSPLETHYEFDTPQGGSGDRAVDKRPEKSTAVASRLIAAGLGVKAPRRTEEQKEYEKAVRAQERRKKEREIEERNRAKQQAEKAKAAIWED